MTRAERAAEQIRRKTAFEPEIACVLGSGWGIVADFLEDAKRVAYADVEGMPACTVAGHTGNFLFGNLFGKKVAIAQGRFHLYEGRTEEEVALPVAVMNALGATKLLVTNAAGGISRKFSVGDLMAISDHINLSGHNPLTGVRPTERRPVFVDMSAAYDRTYTQAISKRGKELGIPVHTGVYAQLSGPSYETPAEIGYLAAIGADAVGMSTAVEVIFAKYLGMRVAGVSCITNAAAGLGNTGLDHKDVLNVSGRAGETFYRLLEKFIPEM